MVTLDFKGNENNEYERKYYEHNHDVTASCTDNCGLTEITNVTESMETKHVPIFIANLSQKHSGLVENFIKNKNFDLHSEDYLVGVSFYLNSNARLNGLLWTFECSTYNQELSLSSLTGEKKEHISFLQYIESSILTTAHISDIKNVMCISQEEANEIQNLAHQYQVNLNADCNNIPLPSYETMFRTKPSSEAAINLISSDRLLEILKTLLLALTSEEKNILTTERWLEDISRNCRFEILEEDKMEIVIQETSIRFVIDDRLEYYMSKYNSFCGTYHYALSCSHEENSIVMRRHRILDCFTLGYNPWLLKAFKSKQEIVPIFSDMAWWKFEEKYANKPPDLENTEIFDLLNSHFLSSITEMYALSDPFKIKDISSASLEYISTYETQKSKFKKVRVPSEDTYEFPGTGFFELLSNNVLRHFGRLNARDLLLVETSLWYDTMTRSDGDEMFNLYRQKLDKIPDGRVIGINGGVFPTLILCQNKQVLKLRSKRKVLHIPNFNPLSREEKYSRVLLFFPIQPGVTIDVERIGEIMKSLFQLFAILY